MDSSLTGVTGEVAKVNESVMALASAPITTPIFNDVEVYTITAAVAEVFTLTVTAAATGDGNVQVTLNGGTPTDVAVTTGDSTSVVAGKIQAVVDALADYVATVNGSVVTVTASNKRSETDATFSGGTTGVTATVAVTTQGVTGSDLSSAVTITVPNSKSYKVGKGNLLIFRNGVPQTLAGGDYTEASSTTIQFSADVLTGEDVITFIIGNPSKLNYSVAVAYYTEGADDGKINTITYTGDIERVITYTYNVAGKIATEAVAEGGVTTTKTFSYNETTGKITGVAAVVA
jgi:hypothetical protein